MIHVYYCRDRSLELERVFTESKLHYSIVVDEAIDAWIEENRFPEPGVYIIIDQRGTRKGAVVYRYVMEEVTTLRVVR